MIDRTQSSSRRMGHGALSCRLGCLAVGGGDVRHYLLCPVVREYARSSRARTPCCAVTRQLRLALGVLPIARHEILVNGVCVCGDTLSTHASAGRKGARGHSVSLRARPSVAHRVLLRDASAVLWRRRQQGTLGLATTPPERGVVWRGTCDPREKINLSFSTSELVVDFQCARQLPSCSDLRA